MAVYVPARGLVLVNPEDATRSYPLQGSGKMVEPHGGGELGGDADVSAWGLDSRTVTGALPRERFESTYLGRQAPPNGR